MLDDRRHSCPIVGHIELQFCQKTSPSGALLLDIRPPSHYCNHILSAPALLPAVNHP
jgi:hypothetical protein